MADLRWWTEPTPLGALTVTVGDGGVRSITRDPEPPSGAFEDCDTEVQDELQEYFSGRRKFFTVPLDLSSVRGDASRTILETLAASVPFGSTIGYGDLAARSGHPGAARAAGQAMAHNPIPILVPCHRVIGSAGVIGGFAWGVDAKRHLLRHEGILWL